MQVSNTFIEETLGYTADRPNLLVRSEEIMNLADISDYLREINESLLYDDSIWAQEVEEGVEFADWLFGSRGEGAEDDRRMLMEILGKQAAAHSDDSDRKKLLISLGEYPDAASERKGYISRRRSILAEIKTAEEYAEFMQSCFINSHFAKDIVQEMCNIKDFPQHAKEITENLSVLNDEAIGLYREYYNNLKEAENQLSSRLLACSGDAAHRDKLFFPFTYYERLNGQEAASEVSIRCEPHLKLIRKDSDLRIYFWWTDEKIGDGEKVLVGRIGRHPY